MRSGHGILRCTGWSGHFLSAKVHFCALSNYRKFAYTIHNHTYPKYLPIWTLNLYLFGLIQQTTKWHFSYFSQKTGFDISCKLSPLETICRKYQNLFSGKNKKNISKCRLLKLLPRMLSVQLKIWKPILLPADLSKTARWAANRADPDQMTHSVLSDLFLLWIVCLNTYNKHKFTILKCAYTVKPRYLELAYFELPLISKWISGPCFNMKQWQQIAK